MADTVTHGYAPGSKGVLRGGAASGIIAGCGFALFGMLLGYATGNGFWSFLQLWAGAFMGVGALVGGPASGVIGAIGLAVVSAIYGVIFASMVDEYTSTGSALWSGLVYGLCVWVLRTFITLPLLNTVMRDRVVLDSGWWFVENLVFGGLLAITPSLKARYTPTPVVGGVRRERVVH